MSRSLKRLARLRGWGVQYAALPWRAEAGLKFLLVTSRETRRWTIPKGWPMKKLAPHEAAALEAFEEAGVEGEAHAEPAGLFRYDKRLRDGSLVICEVQVFPLRVTREHEDWREEAERARAWLTPEAAAERVEEPELKALLLSYDPTAGLR